MADQKTQVKCPKPIGASIVTLLLVFLAAAPLTVAKSDTSTAFIKTEGADVEQIGENKYKLKTGEILSHSRKHMEIITANAAISICPGALVLVSVEDRMTRVLGCFENSLKCVHVTAFAREKMVAEGHELSVASDTDQDTAERLLAATNLRRRRLKFESCGSGNVVLENEFSLLDAALKDKILSRLPHSDRSEEKALGNRIDKGAASLDYLDDHQPYDLLAP